MMHQDNGDVFTSTMVGAAAGHEGGDYLCQTDYMAGNKQKHTPEGRRALLRHGLSYGAAQLVSKFVTYKACGVRVHPLAVLAGQATEVALHMIIDDGRLLKLVMCKTGSTVFHDLGAPRRDCGGEPLRTTVVDKDSKPVVDERGKPVVVELDNASPSTGRALADQAMHKAIQMPAGAIVTTVVNAALR